MHRSAWCWDRVEKRVGAELNRWMPLGGVDRNEVLADSVFGGCGGCSVSVCVCCVVYIIGF